MYLYVFRFVFKIYSSFHLLGCGAIYVYDALGSFEKVKTACLGKGRALIESILDEYSNMNNDDVDDDLLFTKSSIKKDRSIFCKELKLDEAYNLVIKAFQAAAEREITIGDGIDIWVIRANTTVGSKQNKITYHQSENIQNKIEEMYRNIGNSKDEDHINNECKSNDKDQIDSIKLNNINIRQQRLASGINITEQFYRPILKRHNIQKIRHFVFLPKH